MQRNMDLVRSILLTIEQKAPAGGYLDVQIEELIEVPDGIDPKILDEHLYIMERAGFFGKSARTDTSNSIGVLSMDGYDFLDSIRDPEVWAQTKEVSSKAGGWTLELIGEIAKGFLKTKIKQHAGVEV